MTTVSENPGKEANVSGNLILFYSYDVGEEVDFSQIRKNRLAHASIAEPFRHFKNYHIPLAFKLDDLSDDSEEPRTDSIFCKVYNFGVISLCYRVPISGLFENLKVKVIETVKAYEKIAKKDGKMLFDAISPAIMQPSFFLLHSDYYAVQINPQGKEVSAKAVVMSLSMPLNTMA